MARGGGSGAKGRAGFLPAAAGAALLGVALAASGGEAGLRSAAGGSAGAATAVDASAACAVLEIRSVPDGAVLDRVPAPDGRFALSFRHSVTLRPVIDRYAVAPGRAIRQTAAEFDQHGPGLPVDAEPGRPWQRRGDVWVVPLDRPIDRLVVRVDPTAENRLHAGAAPASDDRRPAGASPPPETSPSTGAAPDLTRWGRRAVEIVPVACDRPDSSR